MSGVELAACPFCGETAIHLHSNEDRRFFWAECSKCDVEARGADSEEEARAQWNRRAVPMEAVAWREKVEIVEEWLAMADDIEPTRPCEPLRFAPICETELQAIRAILQALALIPQAEDKETV